MNPKINKLYEGLDKLKQAFRNGYDVSDEDELTKQKESQDLILPNYTAESIESRLDDLLKKSKDIKNENRSNKRTTRNKLGTQS